MGGGGTAFSRKLLGYSQGPLPAFPDIIRKRGFKFFLFLDAGNTQYEDFAATYDPNFFEIQSTKNRNQNSLPYSLPAVEDTQQPNSNFTPSYADNSKGNPNLVTENQDPNEEMDESGAELPERRAANVRERKRMTSINHAFEVRLAGP